MRKVDSASSVNNLSFTMVFNALFVIFTIASTQSAIYGLDGGLNFHWICLWLNSPLILCWFNFCIDLTTLIENLQSLPHCHLLLSEGYPLLSANLRSAKIKLSIERSPVNSICNARDAKHVNIVPYRLEIVRINGDVGTDTLSTGKSLIEGGVGKILCRLQ